MTVRESIGEAVEAGQSVLAYPRGRVWGTRCLPIHQGQPFGEGATPILSSGGTQSRGRCGNNCCRHPERPPHSPACYAPPPPQLRIQEVWTLSSNFLRVIGQLPTPESQVDTGLSLRTRTRNHLFLVHLQVAAAQPTTSTTPQGRKRGVMGFPPAPALPSGCWTLGRADLPRAPAPQLPLSKRERLCPWSSQSLWCRHASGDAVNPRQVLLRGRGA